MGDVIVVKCPHCGDFIYIDKRELNCRIFRHGVYTSTMQQIDPHMCKTECDALADRNEIYGCGKPFRIDENDVAVSCDYI
jgi:DNA-directed RNA polymerase subunit RPC12/RpoP